MHHPPEDPSRRRLRAGRQRRNTHATRPPPSRATAARRSGTPPVPACATPPGSSETRRRSWRPPAPAPRCRRTPAPSPSSMQPTPSDEAFETADIRKKTSGMRTTPMAAQQQERRSGTQQHDGEQLADHVHHTHVRYNAPGQRSQKPDQPHHQPDVEVGAVARRQRVRGQRRDPQRAQQIQRRHPVRQARPAHHRTNASTIAAARHGSTTKYTSSAPSLGHLAHATSKPAFRWRCGTRPDRHLDRVDVERPAVL